MGDRKRIDLKSYSQSIHEFISFIENTKVEWRRIGELVSKHDLLTSDYLHRIELENLDYKERAKIATQLVKNLKLRREYKNRDEILNAINEWIIRKDTVSAMNALNETLGKVRKIETNQKNRAYTFRVLKENE